MRYEEISAKELLAECREFKGREARESGIRLEADPCDPVEVLCGDRRLLRTAVSNLIDMSVGRSRPGGKVTLGFHRDRERATLTVVDDGMGIPFEELRNMFDIISRPQSGGVDDVVDTGSDLLRLCIVRDVADLHGGRIAVRSCEGEGSAFTFYIPCRQAATLSRSSA